MQVAKAVLLGNFSILQKLDAGFFGQVQIELWPVYSWSM